jgi:hypothetical protein
VKRRDNGSSPLGDDPGIPDLKWANENLSVWDVASELDLRLGSNNHIHCWHPENHKHGDRTASVGVHKLRNSVKCFACGGKPRSVLDLVCDVRACSIPEAAAWLEARFDIPRIPRRKHLDSEQKMRIYDVGYEDPIKLLVRSGLWALLSTPAQRIAPALLAFAEPDDARRDSFTLRMSYRAMMTYSGIRSPNAIGRALEELAAFEWIVRENATPKPGALLRETGCYSLTPYSDSVLEIANTLSAKKRETISAERELRRAQRNQRMRQISNQKTEKQAQLQPTRVSTKYESLYPGDSVLSFDDSS